MRTLICLILMSMTSCDSLWTGFKQPNPNSCFFTPGSCKTTGSAPQAPQQEEVPETGFYHDNVFTPANSTDGLQISLNLGEKLHSCGKVRFNVLINILKSRGIDVNSSIADSAAVLLNRMQLVAGVANFPARLSETIRNDKSNLFSMHDVLIAAAEEWVPLNNPDGTFAMVTSCFGSKLFENNSCDKEGFACLMGATPTQIQLDLCTSMINDTSAGVTDSLSRRRLAVAAMFGSVAMCD